MKHLVAGSLEKRMLHQVHLSAEPCCVCTLRNDQIIPSSFYPHLCSLSSFSAIGHCVGSITAPYAGLPIQLVTYLWHATFGSLCVILVVYPHLMFCSMLSCTCMSVSGPGADLFLFWCCCFLSAGTWYPDLPMRVLLEQLSAPSIAHRQLKAFYPALWCLFFFFLKSAFLTRPPLKPNCLICILSITSQQAPATWRRARFFLSRPLSFIHRLLPLLWNVPPRQWEGVQKQTVHSDFTPRIDNNWHEKWATTQSQCLTYVSFFSFFMSFREGALRCLSCRGRPFCLRKSQWGRSWEAPFKTFTRHRSAAPLAK